ncbi:MAG TPA: DUF6600 domain-containing protein [Burkholderiaceae bacterium]|jgi:hypothetical protein|nr:DUF6600 domain-containing protein [Burkholderiaceae bacterium]
MANSTPTGIDWRRAAQGAAAVLAAAVLGLTGAAQSTAEEDTSEADPPGRVGRLSLLVGTAALTDIGSGQTWAVIVNWPITGEQNFATDAGSRAEIRIGSLAVRVDGDSEVDFVRIDDQTIELVVQRGAVELHARNRDTLAEIDLTTPRERIVLDEVGRYRLDVDRVAGLTSLTAASGYARILTGEATFPVSGGQRAEVSGEPVPRVQMASRLADAFDDWVAPLDRRDDALRSVRYVSSETTGVESLDEFGQWRTVADYGQIWFPATVQAGWVPYRFGRWVWVAPWGWTWVDEAPWGFAPFHYGRWVLLNGRWGWVPGQYVARPIYAPCLVVWHGSAAESGMVGWSPLGPADIYVPGYRASPHYVQSVNLQSLGRGSGAAAQSDALDAKPHYTYQHNPAAVTWVHRDTMQLARPVGRTLQPPPAHWISVPVTHLAPVAAPPSPIAAPAGAQLGQAGRSTDRPGVSPAHAVAAEPSRPAPR